MTRLEIQAKIKSIREELETRYKTGTVKTGAKGEVIPTKELQDELFSLIYKLSKLE